MENQHPRVPLRLVYDRVTWVAVLLSIAAKSSILASGPTRCHSPRNVLSQRVFPNLGNTRRACRAQPRFKNNSELPKDWPAALRQAEYMAKRLRAAVVCCLS
jgi:hypothetical protein